MKLTILSAAVVAAGCIGPMPPPGQRTIRLERCSDADTQAVSAAVAEWNAHGAGLSFSTDYPWIRIKCDHYMPDHAGWTHGTCDDRGSDVFLSPASEWRIRTVALHEIGHVLGCRGDHLQPANVMAAYTPDAAPHLTAADLAYAGLR